MNLGLLARILKNRLACASEFEIRKCMSDGRHIYWYLYTTFKDDYINELLLDRFDVDTEDLKEFIENFSREHNIYIGLTEV